MRAWEVCTWNGSFVIMPVGNWKPWTKVTRFSFVRRSVLCGGECGILTRSEVASMLNQNRRTNLNTGVAGPDAGVMKLCPRTMLREWPKPR